jgi:hypothetical protein
MSPLCSRFYPPNTKGGCGYDVAKEYFSLDESGIRGGNLPNFVIIEGQRDCKCMMIDVVTHYTDKS